MADDSNGVDIDLDGFGAVRRCPKTAGGRVAFELCSDSNLVSSDGGAICKNSTDAAFDGIGSKGGCCMTFRIPAGKGHCSKGNCVDS